MLLDPNAVLVAMILTIDLQDLSETTRLYVIIHPIVHVTILLAIVTMDHRHRVNVTTLHITLRHETIRQVIVTTCLLVAEITRLLAVTTSYHELMTLIWLLVAMVPGAQIFF